MEWTPSRKKRKRDPLLSMISKRDLETSEENSNKISKTLKETSKNSASNDIKDLRQDATGTWYKGRKGDTFMPKSPFIDQLWNRHANPDSPCIKLPEFIKKPWTLPTASTSSQMTSPLNSEVETKMILSNKGLLGGARNMRQDVKPQVLSMDLNVAVANDGGFDQIVLPVARVPGTKKVTVIELLRIEAFPDMTAVDLVQNLRLISGIATNNPNVDGNTTLTDLVANTRVFNINLWHQAAAGSFNTASMPGKIVTDYTDGNGNGMLIATDSMFLFGKTDNVAGGTTFGFKMLYRFVEVNPIEFVGIVQSQQA